MAARYDAAMGWLSKTTDRLDRIAVWYGWYAVMSGGYAWLASRLGFLSGLGWPEWIIIGIGASLSTAFVATASLALWRQYRPLPEQPRISPSAAAEQRECVPVSPPAVAISPIPAHFEPRAIHNSQVHVDLSKLEQEHFIEIAIRYFNGSPRPVKVKSLSGQLGFRVVIEHTEIDVCSLPAATIKWISGPIDPVPPYSESMVVLEQPVRPGTVQEIFNAIRDGQARFYFTNVELCGVTADTPEVEFAFTLWEVAILRNASVPQTERLITAGVASATVNIMTGLR